MLPVFFCLGVAFFPKVCYGIYTPWGYMKEGYHELRKVLLFA